MFKCAKVCNNLLTLKNSTGKDRMLCFGSCFGKIKEVCEYKKKSLSWILIRAKQHSESELAMFSHCQEEKKWLVLYMLEFVFGKGLESVFSAY